MNKLNSISNTEKSLWLRVNSSDESIKVINEILLKCGERMGLSIYKNSKGDWEESLLTLVELQDNSTMIIINEEECGYIIFTRKDINVILRKESTKFKGLKKAFEENFKFEKELK